MRERDPPIARITRDRRGLYESRAGDEDKGGELAEEERDAFDGADNDKINKLGLLIKAVSHPRLTTA